jgi:alanine-glyoxylate transaminase/serine-glyoxylate transaminase/serine-pyruvate transaminase
MTALAALGLRPFAQEGYRLPDLICVELPPHIEDHFVRTALLQHHGIEIGGGLGPLQGKVWRIGLMGESSTRANVYTLLGALEQIFLGKGWIQRPGPALEAAARRYADAAETASQAPDALTRRTTR